MKCSRCKRPIEGSEIRFTIEGDWMGKPLCRKCRFDVEEESREKYRRGRSVDNGYPKVEYADSIHGSKYNVGCQFVLPGA